MKINSKTLKQWSRLGQRAMFGQFMISIAKKNKKLMVLSADLGRSSGLDRFKKEFPDKYLSVGIAEQNLIGIASGLAKEGFKVFVTSFAPFLSMRALEQIRMNLGYMKHNVNVVALGSGLSLGFLGNSHYGLEDVGTIKTIPGIKIFSPGDCMELKNILNDLSNNNRGPTYLRLTGPSNTNLLYEKPYKYNHLKENKIIKGLNKKLLILSTGYISTEVKIACNNLKKNKIFPEFIHVHKIKPINIKIMKYAKNFRNILIIEEHSKIGGLKSSIIEKLINFNHKINIETITLPDSFGPTGRYDYLIDYHGMSSNKIKKKILKIYKRSK